MTTDRQTTMWSVALQCIRTAEATDWRDARSAKSAWSEVEQMELQLLNEATTLADLRDKLRYLLGVIERPEDRNTPPEQRSWKQQLLISAIQDVERMASEGGVQR
jgi:hypothetical protein